MSEKEFSRVETKNSEMSDLFVKAPLAFAGAGVTLYFLGSGLKNFFEGSKNTSNAMMKGRVVFQGVTVGALIAYASYQNFFGEPPKKRE